MSISSLTNLRSPASKATPAVGVLLPGSDVKDGLAERQLGVYLDVGVDPPRG